MTDDTIIEMTRVYDAPCARVWEALTEPRHVTRWWGGAGCENPVCEMDVRPGGRWYHVMVFPGGQRLEMNFEFVTVEPPHKLVWKDLRRPSEDMPPSPRITVTLEDLGNRTRWRMVAEFPTPAARAAAAAMGFTGPISASNERLVAYLPTM